MTDLFGLYQNCNSFLLINMGEMTTEDPLGITYNIWEGLGSSMSNTDPQGLFLNQSER